LQCALQPLERPRLEFELYWEDAHALHSDNLQPRHFDRFVGAKAPDDPAVKEISPSEQASSVMAPVLLTHG